MSAWFGGARLLIFPSLNKPCDPRLSVVCDSCMDSQPPFKVWRFTTCHDLIDGRQLEESDGAFLHEQLLGAAALVPAWSFHLIDVVVPTCLVGLCVFSDQNAEAWFQRLLENRFGDCDIEMFTDPIWPITSDHRIAGPWQKNPRRLWGGEDSSRVATESCTYAQCEPPTPRRGRGDGWIPPQLHSRFPTGTERRVIQALGEQDERDILLIVDKRGAAGDTAFAHRLHAVDDAMLVGPPCMFTPREILQTVGRRMEERDPTVQRTIIIDADPWHVQPANWDSLLTTMLSLKRGVAYSDDHNPVHFHWPRLMCFVKTLPGQVASPLNPRLPSDYLWRTITLPRLGF